MRSDDYEVDGVAARWTGCAAALGDGPVYVSIDIDVLDPAHAPGTGTPEAGGLTSRELLNTLRGLVGLNVVGADIVEVAPAYDHAEITGIAASHVAYELLAVLARNRAGGDSVSHRNGGAAIVESLAAHGVDVIFGIPGTHNLELYRHLPSAGIRAVTTRHEQGAGYAADGYHQVSGKPGVVITTSGPALFNVAAAAGTAWAESRAMLIIAPGLPTGTDGGDAGQLHETKDSSGAFDRIVAWSAGSPSRPMMRRRPSRMHSRSSPPAGPARCTSRSPSMSSTALDRHTSSSLPGRRRRHPTTMRSRRRHRAVRRRPPVIVAGGGARRAIGEIRRLAERLGAPVVTTTNGKGVLPEDHPLAIGAAIRLRCVQKHLAASDVALVVGASWATGALGRQRRYADRHPAGHRPGPVGQEPDRSTPPVRRRRRQALRPACWTGLRRLRRIPVPCKGAAERAARLREQCHAEAVADGSRWQPVVDAVRRALPVGSSLVGDSSQVTYFGTAHFFGADKPGEFLYMAGLRHPRVRAARRHRREAGRPGPGPFRCSSATAR